MDLLTEFAGKGFWWYSFDCGQNRLVVGRRVVFLFVNSLTARTSAGRIEMRNLISAMNSVVVSGQVDRTNVAGIGSLRGLNLLLSSCIYSGHALYAALLSGFKSIKPAHQQPHMAEQKMFAMAEAPCWHSVSPSTGSPGYGTPDTGSPAFAWTT